MSDLEVGYNKIRGGYIALYSKLDIIIYNKINPHPKLALQFSNFKFTLHSLAPSTLHIVTLLTYFTFL